VLEAIRPSAVGQEPEPFRRHWRAAGVAAKLTEALPVAGGDADVGMNVEAGKRGAAPAGRDRRIFPIDFVPDLRQPTTDTRAGKYASFPMLHGTMAMAP